MKITNNQQQPSFKALHIPPKEAFGHPGEILFEAMRHALTPKESELLSSLNQLAQKAEVYIRPINEDLSKLHISVKRGNVTVHTDDFLTSQYEKSVDLGQAISQKAVDLYSTRVSGGKTLI